MEWNEMHSEELERDDGNSGRVGMELAKHDASPQ